MLSGLRQMRLEAGLRQEDLAKMTGLNQFRISQLERGITPTPAEAVKLNKVFRSLRAKKASSEVDKLVTLYCIQNPHISREQATRIILQGKPQLAREYLQLRG